MKIEIDLNDILGGDEDVFGMETLQESVRRQVVEALTKSVQRGIQTRIDQETSRILNDELQKVLVEQMPVLVSNIMDKPYTPVDRYGSRNEPTTFRDQLVKAIHEQMTYAKARNGYSSDVNAFTKAVDQTVAENMKVFQAAYTKTVDAEFTKEAMAFATQKLRERLGVKS